MPHGSKRLWPLLACAGMLFALALADSGGAQSAGKTLMVATGVDITTLDPQAQPTRWDAIVASNMFDGLVARNKEMKIVPALAEKWKVSDDGKTITFTLRKDVKFQNGEPFDADVVKWSFDRLMRPDYKSQSQGPFKEILQEVKVLDPSTVALIFSKPNPVILSYLVGTAGYFFPVPPKYIKAVGEDGFIKKPIGTGPFQFVRWDKDDRVTLQANPTYWGGKPKIDRLVFRVIPEAGTRVASLLSGEVNIVSGLSPDDQPKIDSSKVAGTQRVQSTRRIYIQWNKGTKALQDQRVRQAINYAVDKQALVGNLLGGNGFPMAAPVIGFEFGANKDLKPYPYDPEKARSLLTQAGYGSGLSLTLDTPAGRYTKDKEVAQAVGGYLDKVGVKTQVKIKEWATYTAEERKGQLGDLSLWGWGAGGLMDADLALTPFFSTISSRPYSVNFMDPKANELIIAARTEMKAEKRAAMYREANRILHDQADWLFLYNQADVYGVSKDVKWTPRSDEAISGFEAGFE
jgi:peptide/nickel transport system substrate-binding protein